MEKLGILCVGFVLALNGFAHAQEFAVTSSSRSVEKGEDFTLHLRIQTDNNPIQRLEIKPELPRGFTLKKDSPVPTTVEAGSAMILPFMIQAPTHLSDVENQRGVSTRDPKKFIFNISYAVAPTGPKRRAIEFSLRYTTSIYLYLLWGFLGLMLAHVIKSLAKGRTEFQHDGISVKAIRDYVFSKNLLGLTTTAAIGFAVLVILAREIVPTQGWYDSFAMGVILGMLGDEDLLGKLRGAPGAGRPAG